MSLLDMQRVFSRLLTDPYFQREFFADGADRPPGYDLTERELDSLRRMDRKRLRLHAGNLAHARLGLALKSTPLSALVLHTQLDRHLVRFCREYPPIPVAESAVILATTRLCEFAEKLFAEGELRPAYAWDLLRYEKHLLVQGFGVASCASAAEFAHRTTPPGSFGDHVPITGPHVLVDHFRHDLTALLPRLQSGDVPEHVPPLAEPVRILFVKRPLKALVQTCRLNVAMESVWRRCDGVRTVDEIASAYPDPRPVVEALRALHRFGAIALTTGRTC
ncbi:hypothetical protein ACTMS2_14715 [Micromonospora sp. SD12]|uniref:hypothetical protein n=1 Tax=Micromonospora sp. SD12 TaxID=3452216 RepID=UPI003F8A9875